MRNNKTSGKKNFIYTHTQDNMGQFNEINNCEKKYGLNSVAALQQLLWDKQQNGKEHY